MVPRIPEMDLMSVKIFSLSLKQTKNDVQRSVFSGKKAMKK
jgi:hypothetical protein